MSGAARGMRAAVCGGLVAVLAGCGGSGGVADGAQPKAEPRSPGVRGVIKDLRLSGSELEVKPIEGRKPPVVLRIEATYPHGTDWRYDLEYYGLDPGSYDLRDYLQRVDGSEMDGVQSVPVEIVRILEQDGQVEPTPLEVGRVPAMGGYTTFLWVAGVLWAIGLVAFLFLRRRRDGAVADADLPETFADRLKPLLERGMAGQLATVEQARLERMLVGYWRAKLHETLQLGNLGNVAALRTLREHEEAGALIRALEAWLHQPPGRAEQVDLQALLAPYRDLPAAAYERLFAETGESASASTAGASA